MMTRTAVDIVRAYGVTAWTEGRDDWIPDLCHDPIIRHDANREVRLSHAEQRARMRHNFEELRPVFEEVVLAGDDEYVTLVWNVVGRDPNWKLCGIEVFRVIDGRIAEVWNSTYMDGRWGLSKSLGAHIADGATVALPLVRADVTTDGDAASAKLIVPAEVNGIAHWLTQLLGAPTHTGGGLRFAAGGPSRPMTLTVADSQAETIGLEAIAIDAFSIELERSGLINGAIELSATVCAPQAAGPFTPAPPVRLADTFGTFAGSGVDASVADAAVSITADGTAQGRVTLLLHDAEAAKAGTLTFGWREGERELRFSGQATLSAPTNSFTDNGAVQATYCWSSDNMEIQLQAPDL